MKESNLEESLRKYFDETPKEQLEAYYLINALLE